MSETRIVAATEADVPAVLGFIRALAEYEKLSHFVVADEGKLRATLFGVRPAAEALLAYEGGEAVGFALYFGTYSTFRAQPGIFLEDLYVKPEARGRGVGLALLRRLAAIARERGCGRLEWDVLDWNAPAIGFYEKLGARAMGEWTKYRMEGEAMERLAG